MVYFGRRTYRNSRPGFTARDRVHLALPIVLLLGAIVVAIVLGRPTSSPDSSQLPEIAVLNDEPSGAPKGSGHRGRQPPPITVPPVPEVNRDPEPFVEDPSILDRVRDGVGLEGEDEIGGLVYLFHRWRKGAPRKLEPAEVPEYGRLPALAPQLRGRRYKSFLEVQNEPFLRQLAPNPSGVVQYWEVWGSDSANHMHRVLFLEKGGLLSLGTTVELDADFLRLHRYQPVRGGVAQVPEWVAHVVTPWSAPPADPAYGPIIWVLGLSVLSLILVVGLQLRPRTPASRPRRTRERKAPVNSGSQHSG